LPTGFDFVGKLFRTALEDKINRVFVEKILFYKKLKNISIASESCSKKKS